MMRCMGCSICSTCSVYKLHITYLYCQLAAQQQRLAEVNGEAADERFLEYLIKTFVTHAMKQRAEELPGWTHWMGRCQK